MLRPMLLRLPVHPSCAFVKHLHPIAAHVALARFRIFCNHHRPCNVPAAILWPALQNWEIAERKILLPHHFLALPASHRLWKKRPQLRQLRQHFHLFKNSLRRLHIKKRMNAVGHFIERLHLQSQIHPPLGPHQIRHHRNARAARFFKKQRRPFGFHRAVRNFRNLEDRIHLLGNPLQLALLLQRTQKIAQVSIRHFPSWNRLRYGLRDPQL